MKHPIVLFAVFTGLFISAPPGNITAFTGFKNHSSEYRRMIQLPEHDTLIKSDSSLFYGVNEYFIVKYIDGQGFVAFNKKGDELFVIYPFDNGPDYPSEGLFRIIEDDKIGFANIKGEIVIPPRFNAVLPFHDKRAAFCDGCRKVHYGEHQAWEGGQWGFIDFKGNEVIPAGYDKIVTGFNNGTATVELNGQQFIIDISGKTVNKKTMENNKWIARLGESVKQIIREDFQDGLAIKNSWTKAMPSFGNLNQEGLKTEISFKKDDKPVLTYYILPWQNLTEKISADSQDQEMHPLQFVTVTEYALVFVSEDLTGLNTEEKETVRQFTKKFKALINYDDNQKPLDEPLNLPENLQVISATSFNNYISLDIALPGSHLPADWAGISENKMLRVSLIPGQGTVTVNWQEPAMPKTGNNFNKPENIKPSGEPTMFPDYVPKHTPDKATDYMPELAEEFGKLPATKPENLAGFLELFTLYFQKAKAHPGNWVEGNIVLGARPKEYEPTAEELILAEIGDRLQVIIKKIPDSEINKILKTMNIEPRDLTYTRFTFTHVDVMGSGRFFYVDRMEKVRLLGKW